MNSVSTRHRWSQTEKAILLLLSACFLAEASVVFLLKSSDRSLIVMGILVPGLAHLKGVGGCWDWVYMMVGPVIFPLFILTVFMIVSIIGLVRCRQEERLLSSAQRYYLILEVVEVVAPALGFLGTCIALIQTMYRIDPSMAQPKMLKVLLDNSASAFGSTVYGICLAMPAFIFKAVFDKKFKKPARDGEVLKAPVDCGPGEWESGFIGSSGEKGETP